MQVYPGAVSLVPGGSTILSNDCFGRQGKAAKPKLVLYIIALALASVATVVNKAICSLFMPGMQKSHA